MGADRLDLRPLDPMVEEARYERLVARIMEAAEPELSRRFEGTGLFGALADWAWPALSAAAVLALVSGAALALARQQVSGEETFTGVVDVLEVAEPVSSWLSEGRPPTASDLIFALEGERQ
jgi:hypothetical protein